MEDSRKKAKSSAIRLLAFRAQSVSEMQQKLTRQGFDQKTVQAVVNELRDTGYLNDDRFAAEFVRYQLMRKPAGRFLMSAKLKEHGVSEETISRVLTQELSGDKEKKLARQVAEEKRREFPVKLSKLSPIQKQKIGQYLGSRGFSSEVAWETIDQMDEGERGVSNIPAWGGG